MHTFISFIELQFQEVMETVYLVDKKYFQKQAAHMYH